jgi:hypothetical protein
MTHSPAWTIEKFEILLNNINLPSNATHDFDRGNNIFDKGKH